MEKIDGPNLKQWMVQQGNHPISEKQAMLWLTQLTDVLHLVHQHNYFHRDIKPENIMLRSSGQLVLVDFGAAREMTQTYMAHLGDSNITAVSSAGYTPRTGAGAGGAPVRLLCHGAHPHLSPNCQAPQRSKHLRFPHQRL